MLTLTAAASATPCCSRMRIAAIAAADDAALRAAAELAAALPPSRERLLETTAQGRAFVDGDARRLAVPGARSPRGRLGRRCRLSGRGRRRRRRPRHRARAGTARLSAGRRRQPDLGRRAAGPARPDRRPARARRAGADRARRAERALATALDEIGSAAFRADLASMRHETQYTRLFRSEERESSHATNPHGPLRVGVGGPVGSGKTALMDALCKRLRERYDIAAITNDIYTKWDAEYLVRSGALAPERITGVETGGCPHTAIREDASINLAAVADMRRRFPDLDLDPDRIRRRQSRRHLLARARRPHDLRHRRRGRRQDPVQGRPGHHPLRSAGHQQDRPRALRRRLARGDGARRQAHARRAAVRVHQSAPGPGRRRDRRASSRRPAGWRADNVRHSGARAQLANPESSGTLRVCLWIPGPAFGGPGMTGVPFPCGRTAAATAPVRPASTAQ